MGNMLRGNFSWKSKMSGYNAQCMNHSSSSKWAVGVIAFVVIAVGIVSVLSRDPVSEQGNSVSIPVNPANMPGVTTEDSEVLTPIRKALLDSGEIKRYTTAEFPTLPAELRFYDVAKFTEAEIIEYGGGNEYTLTFMYPGERDFDRFGDFYIAQAKEGGWKLNAQLYAINGTKVVFENETTEVRALSYIKKDKETEEIYVKEKIKIFMLEK